MNEDERGFVFVVNGAPPNGARTLQPAGRVFNVNVGAKDALVVTGDGRVLVHGGEVITERTIAEQAMWWNFAGILSGLLLARIVSAAYRRIMLRRYLARQPKRDDGPFRTPPPSDGVSRPGEP